MGFLLILGTWTNSFIAEDAELTWWNKIISGTGSVLDFIFTQIAVFTLLTLLSPLNTFLSERVDKDLTGKKLKFNIGRFLKDFFRMVILVAIALISEYLFMLIWWLFAWFMGISSINGIIFFLSASFFYGFSFYDYSLERYEIGVIKSFRFSIRNFLPTMVTGIFFMATYYIPVIGMALAPILTTIVSTHVFLKSTGRLDPIVQKAD